MSAISSDRMEWMRRVANQHPNSHHSVMIRTDELQVLLASTIRVTDETVDGLLPCPFCNGEAKIVDAIEAGPQAQVVSCQACGASSPVVYALMDDVTSDLRGYWNTRALDMRLKENVAEALGKPVAWQIRFYHDSNLGPCWGDWRTVNCEDALKYAIETRTQFERSWQTRPLYVDPTAV